MADFLPEYTYLPIGALYRPAYRLFVGQPLHLVPSVEPCVTVSAAINAAKDYVREKLNPPIRVEHAEMVADVLGVDAWHQERAERRARDQEQVLGAIVIKGRQVKVERRRRV